MQSPGLDGVGGHSGLRSNDQAASATAAADHAALAAMAGADGHLVEAAGQHDEEGHAGRDRSQADDVEDASRTPAVARPRPEQGGCRGHTASPHQLTANRNTASRATIDSITRYSPTDGMPA